LNTVSTIHTFLHELATCFEQTGPLAQALPNYRVRQQQIEMAQAIGRALLKRSSLLVEAGTGTGKTFAYLLPAMLRGGKVILSTGTKNLQSQLFQRDIPQLRGALNVPITVALLKGRANYVCHYHLAQTKSEGLLESREQVAQLRRVEQFAQVTQTGDKADCVDVPEESGIWAHVTSTRENCLGQECAYVKECFLMNARKQAQEADLVVVNHHLFFADVMLRDEGVAELLPTSNTVIFDEAHQLPDTATLFFGEMISTRQLLEWSRDTLAEGLSEAREVDWPSALRPLETATRDLRLAFGLGSQKLAHNQIGKTHGMWDALSKVRREFEALLPTLEAQAVRSEGLAKCQLRAEELLIQLRAWEKLDDPETVRWIDVSGHNVQLHRTPLSVAELFTKQREDTPRSWIFTSATLGVGDDFSHFQNLLGLQEADCARWDSPFNYPEQGLLYVPQQMPEPQHPEYLEAVLQAALPVLEASQGHAFMLCTTLRAVDQLASRLQEELAQRKLDYPLLVQGSESRNVLLERFRQTPHAILVGSHSFWEGVDVPGDALSLVIIDKLPFAPPDDPVLAARLRKLEAEGGKPFMDYQLPAAIMALKQGAGRLIRSETDRGVLMICDPRLISKGYGKKIWRSLPDFARTRELAVAQDFWKNRVVHDAT
jgi:ATP-dependent DNA helicase DinG